AAASPLNEGCVRAGQGTVEDSARCRQGIRYTQNTPSTSSRPPRLQEMTQNQEICSEDEVHNLVHSFYATIRSDELLGPIFDAHISDCCHHLGKMVDFWSAILRGSARYHGTPMPKHALLPALSSELFQRWLALFRATTASLDNPAVGH